MGPNTADACGRRERRRRFSLRRLRGRAPTCGRLQRRVAVALTGPRPAERRLSIASASVTLYSWGPSVNDVIAPPPPVYNLPQLLLLSSLNQRPLTTRTPLLSQIPPANTIYPPWCVANIDSTLACVLKLCSTGRNFLCHRRCHQRSRFRHCGYHHDHRQRHRNSTRFSFLRVGHVVVTSSLYRSSSLSSTSSSTFSAATASVDGPVALGPTDTDSEVGEEALLLHTKVLVFPWCATPAPMTIYPALPLALGSMHAVYSNCIIK
ncbi:hypothetical protein C8Q78DRAFT_643180 [Trametes maxima]|nr:hypothetical protein C8Q78DRAFT_643180 [Trametes maxima]